VIDLMSWRLRAFLLVRRSLRRPHKEIAISIKPSGAKPTGRTKFTAVAPQQTGKKSKLVRKNPGPQRPTPDTRLAHRTAPTANRSEQARLIAMLTSPAGGTLKQMLTSPARKPI
jgi:hypothetical protein